LSVTWSVLAFTFNDVMGDGLDRRLADECVKAWRAAGRPSSFDIRKAPGNRPHMIYWYVSEAASCVLDVHHAYWRRFQIGFASAAPAEATSALEIDDSSR
jgi:hypothetical protein